MDFLTNRGVMGGEMTEVHIMDTQELIAREKNVEFHFFWTTKSPFSQFYRSEFITFGDTYTCAEQYMMAAKAMLFEDMDTLEKIDALPYPEGTERETPKKYKALGRQVKNFNKEEWDFFAPVPVYDGNYMKFTQNNDLKAQLLRDPEKNIVFVEASPYDEIWGIGLKEDDPRAKYPAQWPGKNQLGFILTALRRELLNQPQ